MFLCCASKTFCDGEQDEVIHIAANPMMDFGSNSIRDGPQPGGGAFGAPTGYLGAPTGYQIEQAVAETPKPVTEPIPVFMPLPEPEKPQAKAEVRPPFADQKPTHEREFKVTFGGRDIGLTLVNDGDGTSGAVLIVELHQGGEALVWNGAHEPAEHIKFGDRMVEVTGVRTPMGILEALKGPTRPLEVTIRRPTEFKVTLVKSAATPKIGLGIAPSGSQSLLVKMVNEGMVQEWNKVNPNQQIRAGDRIVDVNGVRGDAQKLLEAIQSKDVLNVTFSRNSDG